LVRLLRMEHIKMPLRASEQECGPAPRAGYQIGAGQSGVIERFHNRSAVAERIAPTATALTFGSLVISSEPTSCLLEPMARVVRGGLPLNNCCSDDQQPEKDRQQYRRYEPLTNTESIDNRHLGPPFQNGGSATLSVTDKQPGERAVIWGGMVTLRRITKLVATKLS
jgi:hypothetical protein